MKNSKIMRSLATMSLFIALFAGKSRAGDYLFPAGSFTVTTHRTSGCENPNGFPVVIVNAQQLVSMTTGFLLDGSEVASNWLKTFQDAALTNRAVVIHIDDNWAHVYCGQLSEFGYTGGAYKLIAVEIQP